MRASIGTALLLGCYLFQAVPAQPAEHSDPSPQIHTQNLPDICPSAPGYYQVPDLKDPTSYYVCCDAKNTVRKTCRHFPLEAGVYQPLVAAPYQPAAGTCGEQAAERSSGSFRAPSSASPSLLDLLRYRFAPSLETREAKDTCESAALLRSGATDNTTSPTTRQAANTQAGDWVIINNRNGVSSTGVVAINAVLLPESDRVLFWSRVHFDRSTKYEPGVVSSDGVPEVSTVYDPTTGEYAVHRMRLTPFCTGNSIMPSGQVLATGGDDYSLQSGYTDGLRGIRLFERQGSGGWGNATWNVVSAQGLREPRWYPTQTLLPDGNRVVITGGVRSMNTGVAVPSAEIYDHGKRAVVKLDTLAVLQRFGSFITYPLMYVLPYTSTFSPGIVHLFAFNCDGGAVLRLRLDNTWQQYRDVPSSLWPTPNFCSAMSMAGTATLLMLEPETNYAAEVVMFGGFQRGKPQCSCDQPTLGYAHRIRLDKKTVDDNAFRWQKEQMPYSRNLNDCVLLPNGQIIVMNGAKTGLIDHLRNPAYNAWLYNPKAAAGSRFTTLAASRIKRYYHSVALLLPDASILVAGSEYSDCTSNCAASTPWLFQHQAERFRPPYFFNGGRPVITSISSIRLQLGGTVTLTYTGTVSHAVLMAPAAVTHQVNMNQRGVKLTVVSNDTTNRRITVRMPPNSYIMQPGYHMLFLMNRDIPCTRATWVQLNL